MKISTIAFLIATAVTLAMIYIGYKEGYSPLLTFLAVAIGLAILYSFYQFEVQNNKTNLPTTDILNTTPRIKIPHRNFSGTLDEESLPAGYGIIYENAWQKPIIGTVYIHDTQATLVDFGNGIVIINSVGNTAEILETKGNVKIIVRFIDETKISFGY